MNIIKYTILFFLILPLYAEVDYNSEIQPIFDNNCISCHIDGGAYFGGLDLSSYSEVMEGGDSGNTIVPFDSENSLLWQHVNSSYMPPYGSGSSPLTTDQINLIAQWIDEGALHESNSQDYEFSDFVGTWDGNITNDQTWSYDDPIGVVIEANNEYTVTNNPGGHLVSDLYPGTEEVYYNSSTNILMFQWVLYYHYSCGGACYTSVPFQVMEFTNGELTLYYNNGSGPAPQANSMFLSLDGWSPDLSGDINSDGIINVLDVVMIVNIVLNNEYNELADLNDDSIINVLDIVQLVNIILN